jgi:Ras family protein
MFGYDSSGGRSGDESDGSASSPVVLSGSASMNGSPSTSSQRFPLLHSQTRMMPSGMNRTTLRRTRSIVVLGFSMVGKTALCVRAVNERFEEAYEPTYENSFVKIFMHRGEEIECLIKDTQGVGEQEIFRNEYGLGVHGYILVYSVASQRSFDIVQSINQKLINLMGTKHVPRVLVGNKIDLVAGTPSARQVSTEAGQSLADQWGCAFLECSAKSDINCDTVFHTLLDEIDEANEPDSTARKLHEMQRCWRSILCCCCSCNCLRNRINSGNTSISSVSIEDGDSRLRLTPLSQADSIAAAERATFRCKLTVWLTLLISIAGIIVALVFGANFPHPHSNLILSKNGSESISDIDELNGIAVEELLSYVIFGFSLLLSLLSILGIYALRYASIPLIHVYGWAVGVLFIGQMITVGIFTMQLSLISNHLLILLLIIIPTWLVEFASSLYAFRAAHHIKIQMDIQQQRIGNNGGSARRSFLSTSSSPFSTDFHSNYHSFE